MPTIVSAEQFWDLYFRNVFLTLERRDRIYAGLVFASKFDGRSPQKVLALDDDDEIQIEVSVDVIRSHDYAGDGRFAMIVRRPESVAASFVAVIEKAYPHRDAAPFGKDRMSELFMEISSTWSLPPDRVTLAALENLASSMAEQYSNTMRQHLAALAWLLGEHRQRTSTTALLAIIRHAYFFPAASRPIPFTAVDPAMSALWKVNDKACLFPLLELLETASAAARRNIVPLFERLLSTTELLSLRRCDDDYFRPQFWREQLEPYRAFSPVDWDRYDVRSLFWELRWLAALRLPSGERRALEDLAHDEVETVGDAASSRLAQ